MLIIEIKALPNGAHRNQAGQFITIPDGWSAVPAELEQEAQSYLPYINLTVEDSKIVAVAQGEIPEPVPEPTPEMTMAEAELDLLTDINYRLSLVELGLTEGDKV